MGPKGKATKRKKEKEVKADMGIRKKKRVKLDRLENWGEAWLVQPIETPGPSKRMRPMEMEFGKMGVINLLKTPTPKLTQESLDEDTNPEADKLPTRTKLPTLKPSKKGGKKLPKKESLALIRKTNTKISGWLTPTSKPEMVEDDWSDDISVPEIQATEDIERREFAKMKAEVWKGRRLCKELVLEMVLRVEGLSSATLCMELVLNQAWKESREREIRRMLDGDDDMIKFTSDLLSAWRVMEVRQQENERVEERLLKQAMLAMEWKTRRMMMMEIDPAEMILTLSQEHHSTGDIELIDGMKMMILFLFFIYYKCLSQKKSEKSIL